MATIDDINNTLQNIARQLGANTSTTTLNNVTINNATINTSTINDPVIVGGTISEVEELTVGGTNQLLDNFGDQTKFQVNTIITDYPASGIGNWSDNTTPAIMMAMKSRATTIGGYGPGTGVLTGDQLFSLVITSDIGGIATWAGTIDFNVEEGTVVGAHNKTNFSVNLSDRNFPSEKFTVDSSGGISTPTVISVTRHGADPTGVADSTTAIQAAIDALPATGGTILFPAGDYLISSAIRIGNGTSSSASTVSGIYLRGEGAVGFSYGGSPFDSPVRIIWGGSGGGVMVSVAGPMLGWGISNIYLQGDGANNADTGLDIVSASMGSVDNFSVSGCAVAGILSETWEPYTGNPNDPFASFSNNFRNVRVFVPDAAFAKGIKLGGGGTTPVTNDTAFCQFDNVFIVLATAGVNTVYGFFFEVCDSNVVTNIHIQAGGANQICWQFDYSVDSAYPNSNSIYHAVDDVSGGVVEWNIDGSPGSAHQPNGVFGIARTNGGAAPNIAGMYWYEALSWRTATVLVSELDTSAPAGTRAIVSDATATTFASIVAGSGGNTIPVYRDSSSNWRIG